MKVVARIIALILMLFTCKANAQTDKVTDSIFQKMYWYALQNPSSKLFVHFDKNIYTNSENVWFTGYLLKRDTKDNHHTLSVAVIRNDDKSVLTTCKFVINQDIVFGSFFLPDSLPAGNYSFVCYTNQLVNGYPSALFVQPVTIKSANTAGFVANLSLLDSIKPNMDTATVLLRAYTANISAMKGVAVTYFIGDRSHPFKSGKIKTDKFGEAKISIPLKQISAANDILQAEIDNGKEIKTFSVKLPVYKKEAVVKFYPEGGNMVSNISNVIGWEAVNNEDEPLQLSAGLYRNEQLLQSIQTNAYGVGRFNITPVPGNRYSVKLQSPEYPNDTTYNLPLVLQNAPVINMGNALAGDTLSLRLNNVKEGSQWIVMIHNFKSTFVTAPVTTERSSTMLKISLEDVPKGLNTFTLLDILGRPVAERLFFAHFDKKLLVNISTDTTTYLPRQKVELNFKITDAQHNAMASLVSIACVQDNRLDIKKMADIESYVYLKSELAAIPFRNKLLSNDADNKEYLENLLLVKGWTRYTWQDLARVTATDTINEKSSLRFTGMTLLNDKPLKKPVQLNLRKFIDTKISTLEYLNTDTIGHFELMAANLLSQPERKLELTVNNRMQDQYIIHVNDPYKEMNKKLAGSLLTKDYDVKSFTQSSQTVVLSKDEGGKKLLDVTVISTKDNSIFNARVPGPNACGDYVCMYGVLNCPNHPSDGFQPVVGMRYTHKSAGSNNNGSYTSVYEGCESLRKDNKEYFFSMDGIYKKKEFYVNDLSKTDPTDPQYLSTLYWNHAVLTNKNGEGSATFYTGDITGKFRIIIQGITNNNVVYGEHSFDVKK